MGNLNDIKVPDFGETIRNAGFELKVDVDSLFKKHEKEELIVRLLNSGTRDENALNNLVLPLASQEGFDEYACDIIKYQYQMALLQAFAEASCVPTGWPPMMFAAHFMMAIQNMTKAQEKYFKAHPEKMAPPPPVEEPEVSYDPLEE